MQKSHSRSKKLFKTAFAAWLDTGMQSHLNGSKYRPVHTKSRWKWVLKKGHK